MSAPSDRRSQRLKRRWPSVTVQFIFFGILLLTAFLLLVAFGSVKLHQQAMRTLVGERDERTVAMIAGALDEQLRHRSVLVQTLALQAGNIESAADLRSQMPVYASDFDLGMAVFSPAGEPLAFDGDAALWSTRDGIRATTLSALVANEEPGPTFATVPDVDSPENSVIFVAARGPEKRVAVGAFSLRSMADAIFPEALDYAPRSSALLADERGRPIYFVGDMGGPEQEHMTPILRQALQDQRTTAFLNAGDGEYVVAFSTVDAADWLLLLAEPWKDVTSPYLRTTLAAPLVLAPMVLLALIAIWFGVRQIVRPLRSLETKAAALAWGQYEPIEEPVGGITEIQHLQAELIHLASKVKTAQQNLRSYIGAITAGQEEERKRLARELHDETLQALIALNQRTQLVQLEAKDPAVVRSLAEIQGLISESIANLRRFVKALRPIYLEDLGLVTALNMLVRETETASKVQATFQSVGPQRRFPPAVELALYRMTQEALSNVVRHANAQHVQVTSRFTSSDFLLTIEDDGQGFVVPDNPAEFARRGHFGLLGLQERAELIGAELTVVSVPGQGVRVMIKIAGDSGGAQPRLLPTQVKDSTCGNDCSSVVKNKKA